MAKGAERLPGTSSRIRSRDDGCCSVNFLKYVLHIYNVVLFVSINHSLSSIGTVIGNRFMCCTMESNYDNEVLMGVSWVPSFWHTSPALG